MRAARRLEVRNRWQRLQNGNPSMRRRVHDARAQAILDFVRDLGMPASRFGFAAACRSLIDFDCHQPLWPVPDGFWIENRGRGWPVIIVALEVVRWNDVSEENWERYATIWSWIDAMTGDLDLFVHVDCLNKAGAFVSAYTHHALIREPFYYHDSEPPRHDANHLIYGATEDPHNGT